MDVSIIIVNYNTKYLLFNCLKSIYEQTKGIDFEIIVSDNGSSDGSIEMMREYFPDVIIIENHANLGFGTANNRAAQIASGAYFLFLNTDTILLNNAILLFYDAAKRNKLSLVGCLLLNEHGAIIHSAEKFASPFKSFIRLAYHSFPLLRTVKLLLKKDAVFAFRDSESSKKVNYITGADLFIESKIFWILDGFDENFFMYFEDDDICRRAHLHGYESYIIASAKIIHLGGGSTTKNIKKIIMEEKSYFVYMKKYNGKLKYWFVRMMYFFFSIVRMLSPLHSYSEKIELLKSAIAIV
jgi:GT2 family glycosyltransferase